ncbi:putative butyrophilin subfamily 2 member A3 isoform X4 [Gadus morhua]|uniref:Putative butyrophilin subfamily 2 member A3 n=1 Tax=Gadus morhua TaxID=8049 RepID=A0A8C4Z3G6_GADMO|nr:putative butyrophilin subfamily 2 member A3 isoform X3 [Gadus morhua]XP_030213829.1 putative butyrophilin subfamily 2 member A3 isoform X4 [Gadus morhua]
MASAPLKQRLFRVRLLHLLMFPTLLHGKIITMTAQVGEDVFLSHYLKLPKELTETLKCYKVVVDEKDKMVGLGRNFYIDCFKDKPPKDNSKLPSPENSGRTSLLLKDVILFNVTRADEGNYIFAFPLERKEYTIQLLIGVVSSVTISLEECPDCSGLVLRCESVGWYPRPQLSWWTDGGLPLPAVTMNTTRDPTDGLYTISSTVVVERGQGARNYSCRVHQEWFNQNREAEIAIQEDHFPSCSRHHWWLVPALVIFVFALVLLVIVSTLYL